MEMLKTVTEPITQVAKISELRGLYDQLASRDEEVLLLEGEIHSNMKPGFLRFGSDGARKEFTRLVLTGIRPIGPIHLVAERIARRMQAENDGRQFMSAHMRRGDFVVFSWTPENIIEAHIARVKDRLLKGLQLVKKLSHSPPQTVDVPGITPLSFFGGTPLPLPSDKFFVLTDERSPEALDYMRKQGVVLVQDLITEEDRRLVGWPLLFGDVSGQVEQLIASYGVFFSGHTMSSLAGGIANLRAARGFDPQTSVFD